MHMTEHVNVVEINEHQGFVVPWYKFSAQTLKRLSAAASRNGLTACFAEINIEKLLEFISVYSY